MEGKVHEVVEEVSERCGYILKKKLHRKRKITSMPNDMVQSLLHR